MPNRTQRLAAESHCHFALKYQHVELELNETVKVMRNKLLEQFNANARRMGAVTVTVSLFLYVISIFKCIYIAIYVDALHCFRCMLSIMLLMSSFEYSLHNIFLKFSSHRGKTFN